MKPTRCATCVSCLRGDYHRCRNGQTFGHGANLGDLQGAVRWSGAAQGHAFDINAFHVLDPEKPQEPAQVWRLQVRFRAPVHGARLHERSPVTEVLAREVQMIASQSSTDSVASGPNRTRLNLAASPATPRPARPRAESRN